MEFIGREQEQKAIQKLLDSKGYQAGILYGRRRRGKTELIKHVLSNNSMPFIRYQCKESSEEDNAQLLTEQIRSALNIPYLYFNHFMDAVSFLFEYSKDHSLCLVLDEYPYIRGLIKGCDSQLQNIIDKHARSCNLKFFLLGSSIQTREDIQSQHSSLYRRFHLSLLLKQRDYFDSAKFYPSFSLEDKVKLYAAFGGVPFYNAQINEKDTVKENIIRLITGKFSGLNDFFDTYLKQEIRKVNNANLVFDSIATGAFHYSDILAKSKMESSPLLNNILQKLRKRDLIEYIPPINAKEDKKKSGYKLSDSCLRFYYHYLTRNESSRAILSEEAFYDQIIEKDFNRSFVPKAFEEIAKQYLIRRNQKGALNPRLFDIGTYWYDNPKEKKNGQFDVVGKAKEGYVFYECKYTEDPINDSIIQEEIKQVEETTLKPVQYGFISKSGFRLKEKYPYQFITLEDRYK